MLRFLRCVAEAVVEMGAKGLVEMVPGGAYAWGLAERVWKRMERYSAEEQRQAILHVATQSGEAARQEGAAELVGKMADPAEALALELYLAAIPDAVRQSLKRPEDPSGRSLPKGFAPRSPEDVVAMLPGRPPRFRPGGDLPQRLGWKLERLLGVGGFGEVWLTRNGISTKLVGAVKFCLGEQARDLQHEAAVITRLMDADDHPHLVRIRDACLEGTTPWLMFDYVAGGTLTDWIHAAQNLASAQRQERVLAVFTKLVDAVAFCHRLDPPIVHRDLKPANVLMDAADLPRVTDFGIGSVVAQATLREETRGQSTRAGRLLTYLRGSHTPLYASPQQREGAAPSPQDDVYALGVIAYQMLTGHLSQGAGVDFGDDLREAGASEPLIELLSKCVANKAERRPSDGRELAERLAQVRGTAVAAPAMRATPRPEPVVEELTEWEILVPGTWERRPANDEKAEWKKVADTPGTIQVRPDLVYSFWVSGLTMDEQLATLPLLAKFSQLCSLSLSGETELTDAGLAYASKLSQLTSLNLSGCEQITDAGLAHVSKLSRLKSLNLSWCAQVPDDGLVQVAKLSQLNSLHLRRCNQVTEAGLVHLAKLPQLRFLDLTDCQATTDTGLAHLSKSPQLSILDLSLCQWLTDTGLSPLGELSQLRSLCLYKCDGITDAGLTHIGELSQLKSLSLSGCEQITDAGLVRLAKLSFLNSLDLSGCEQITDAGLVHLAKLTLLNSLSLHEILQVTDAGIARLKKANPRLKIER